jgi:hypothetical protein
MSALVIHAPKRKVEAEGKRSFEETLRTGVGDGYAIARSLVKQVNPGSKVILLDKWRDLRAEGVLLQLVPTEKTGNGIQRYDVHVKDWRSVPYKTESVNRNGVAVIDWTAVAESDNDRARAEKAG